MKGWITVVDLKLQIPVSFFEEEVRSGFIVTKQRKELWAVQLDLIYEFDRVCKSHDLKYYADSGTALGAVRHKGFIPWDDDVDIAMFRSEYNKLCEIAPKEFKYPYFFQTEHTDRGSMRGHAQLRNSQTTAILMTELDAKLPFNQGIFIDIFPMDNVPDDECERRRFVERLEFRRKMARIYARLSSRYRECPASFREYAIRVCHSVLGSSDNPFYRSFEKFAQSFHEPTGKVALLCFPDTPESLVWEKSWYRESVMIPFEMLEIPVCADYDAYLTKNYGNWKIPVHEDNYHGCMIIDTDKPYTEHIGFK